MRAESIHTLSIRAYTCIEYTCIDYTMYRVYVYRENVYRVYVYRVDQHYSLKISLIFIGFRVSRGGGGGRGNGLGHLRSPNGGQERTLEEARRGPSLHIQSSNNVYPRPSHSTFWQNMAFPSERCCKNIKSYDTPRMGRPLFVKTCCGSGEGACFGELL